MSWSPVSGAVPSFNSCLVSTPFFGVHRWLHAIDYQGRVVSSSALSSLGLHRVDMYTTSSEDQKEAARLKARLENASNDNAARTDSGRRLPNVTIAEGAHKYVLISAVVPGGGERQHFVVSRKNAHYHRNAAEPFIERLEDTGYSQIDVTGGGRIAMDSKAKIISIYGFSYGFGQADHELSQAVVRADARYKDYKVTISNEGY